MAARDLCECLKLPRTQNLMELIGTLTQPFPRYDMTNQKSTSTIQVHVRKFHADSIKDERILAELKTVRKVQPTLEDTLKRK